MDAKKNSTPSRGFRSSNKDKPKTKVAKDGRYLVLNDQGRYVHDTVREQQENTKIVQALTTSMTKPAAADSTPPASAPAPVPTPTKPADHRSIVRAALLSYAKSE